MATAKCLFNTQTLSIFNMVDPGETINYNWSIDQDYSVVVLEGSIDINSTVVKAVNELLDNQLEWTQPVTDDEE